MNPEQLQQTLEKVKQAVAESKLSASAAENMRAWLTEPRYAAYADEVAAHVAAGKWKVLDDVFWTVIPFGTGGRRGKMYPIGSNAINDRTIGESAQGLADYVKETLGAGAPLSCAIGYDTRHRSDHFAQLCAEIMTAAGFTVYFLKGIEHAGAVVHGAREEVLVRHHGDGQPQPAERQRGEGLLVHRRADHSAARQGDHRARDEHAGDSAGRLRQDAGRGQDRDVPGGDGRQVSAGGADAGVAGAAQVEGDLFAAAWRGGDGRDSGARGGWLHGRRVFGPHSKPDGDFPNVPGHVANPENPAVFDSIIVRGREVGADVTLATDPDCDRIGCAAPLTFKPRMRAWHTLTGNQLCALLGRLRAGESQGRRGSSRRSISS